MRDHLRHYFTAIHAHHHIIKLNCSQNSFPWQIHGLESWCMLRDAPTMSKAEIEFTGLTRVRPNKWTEFVVQSFRQPNIKRNFPRSWHRAFRSTTLQILDEKLIRRSISIKISKNIAIFDRCYASFSLLITRMLYYNKLQENVSWYLEKCLSFKRDSTLQRILVLINSSNHQKI